MKFKPKMNFCDHRRDRADIRWDFHSRSIFSWPIDFAHYTRVKATHSQLDVLTWTNISAPEQPTHWCIESAHMCSESGR